ncbi:MAG TPA: 1,4-dihydroxy-2-naphthoate octaprenyltransferase [Rhodobacteraceae bacterium]|nr:1,4-dihydroxy-2-naphthoate octaprenyltransferase [Paracoccaceae bacterium]
MNSTVTPANTSAQLTERLGQLPKPVLLFIAARVKTLGLSLTPVAAGTWLAAQSGGWSLPIMIAAMVAAAMIQIGTNLWNDAADGGRGTDGPNRLGPPRMTGLGLLDAELVRRAAITAFGIAALFGLWLTMIGGWPVVAIGLVSLALGYFYSMGPRPLSHTALGEGLVVLFFGIVAVGGTVYLHGQPLTGAVLALGIITGLPAAAVLLINNHRDRDLDQIAGRKTLAIVIGQGATRGIYALFLVVALIGAALFSATSFQSALPLLPAGVIAVVLIVLMMKTPVSYGLNRMIAGTVGFQVLLLVGIALAKAFGA